MAPSAESVQRPAQDGLCEGIRRVGGEKGSGGDAARGLVGVVEECANAWCGRGAGTRHHLEPEPAHHRQVAVGEAREHLQP